jgi:hypothetical protein
MGQCMAMGQAAGFAAALSIQDNCLPTELPIEVLQNKLRHSGALLD